MRSLAALVGLLLLLSGCTDGPPTSFATTPPQDGSPVVPSVAPTPPPSATTGPTPPRTPTPTPRRVRVDAGRVLRDIETLAVDIGPREATSPRYARAADWVERRLTGLGYRVRRETVRVPSGTSWGVPVRAGRSVNLVAEPPGFNRETQHRVVGAHLDTVPQAPGAEDNASGVAVLLELARLAAANPPGVPVRFIAFGAEEPRGTGDALHHFGSRRHVADLSRAELDAVAGMVSLDRVGVRAAFVPVCRGGPHGTRLRSAIGAAGRQADIATRACANRSSDHWSYERVGLPAVRIGSIPYPEYHSRRDLPPVVDRRQLDRVGRLVWVWLSRRG